MYLGKVIALSDWVGPTNYCPGVGTALELPSEDCPDKYNVIYHIVRQCLNRWVHV
jgi:hypothetical protein